MEEIQINGIPYTHNTKNGSTYTYQITKLPVAADYKIQIIGNDGKDISDTLISGKDTLKAILNKPKYTDKDGAINNIEKIITSNNDALSDYKFSVDNKTYECYGYTNGGDS